MFRFVFEDQVEFVKASIMDDNNVYLLTTLIMFCGETPSACCFLVLQTDDEKPTKLLEKSIGQNRLWRSFRSAFHSRFYSCRGFHVLPPQIIRIEIDCFKHVESLYRERN
jgi:hypothetical protein